MLKIISLNLERSKHLHLNLPFFQRENPDVLCLQEVLEADIDRIAQETGLGHHLWLRDILTDAPANSDGKTGYSGPALFARSPFIASGSEYYYMPQNGIQLERESEFYSETNAHGIVWATVEKGDEQYTLVTTHFTWSEDGRATEKQKSDFEHLKKILDTLPPHILTGDLNAPRGFGIWEKFVAYYGRDYIPQGITSTIDPNLHRVKNLQLVVDGIFAHPMYHVDEVAMVEGVSDHKALVASITQH